MDEEALLDGDFSSWTSWLAGTASGPYWLSHTTTLRDIRTTFTPPFNGVDVWCVNLTISWANVPYARKLYASFNSIWSSNYSTYKVKANTLTGHLQLLQIIAPPGISPHQVREGVNYAASTTIQGSLNSSGVSAGKDTVGTFLAAGALAPEVNVTFSTIVLQDNSSITVANGH